MKHFFQIDNATGALCCDAWLNGQDERGRLVVCPDGYRYEDAECLGPNEDGYLVYQLDEASLDAKDISLPACVPPPDSVTPPLTT